MFIHVLGQYLAHKKCGRFLLFGATAAPLIVYTRLLYTRAGGQSYVARGAKKRYRSSQILLV